MSYRNRPERRPMLSCQITPRQRRYGGNPAPKPYRSICWSGCGSTGSAEGSVLPLEARLSRKQPTCQWTVPQCRTLSLLHQIAPWHPEHLTVSTPGSKRVAFFPCKSLVVQRHHVHPATLNHLRANIPPRGAGGLFVDHVRLLRPFSLIISSASYCRYDVDLNPMPVLIDVH